MTSGQDEKSPAYVSCSKSRLCFEWNLRPGRFTVQVKTIAKRLGRGLKAVWEWCKQHRHDAVNEQQKP
jgi:hypothetical protein